MAGKARGWVVGALICGGLVIALAYVFNSRISAVLATQATARAMDHVRLVVLSRLTLEDFAEPHSRDKLADIQRRLDPGLRRLSSDDSGVADVDLIAADGIIIYSDQPGNAGHPASHRERSALDQALAGHVATVIDTDDPIDQAANRVSDTTLDVYVPVVMGGLVVGAYEMDLVAPSLPWNEPLVLLLLAGPAAGLLYLLWRARAGHRPVRRAVPMGLPAPAAPLSLSARELEVLGLLADGHSYRGVADQLVVSEETVRSHVKRILRKTGEANRTAAVAAALRAGMIGTPSAGATVDAVSPDRVRR